MPTVPFAEVLAYLEARGWVLKRIDAPYRVFLRSVFELPILVEVHDKSVKRADFDHIKTLAD
ncbi:MAG: hypothetical protein ACKVS8_02320 [Phycisphaerales bacterium]